MSNRFQSPRYKPVRRTHCDRRRSSGVKLIFTENELGRGAYGRVFVVNYAGTPCAAKQMHPIFQNATENELRQIRNDFLKECDIWSKLRHPHIVQLLEVYPCCDDSPLPTIVMEKMQLSLRNLVETYSCIPLNVKASMLNDVALGLEYLHSCNPPIAHRDITPNNVLLGNDLQAKISDMGVAKVLQCDAKAMTMTKAPGTTGFMPPESLDDSPHYGLPLDVFSYGAVSLYTITQLWPELKPLVISKPNGKLVRLSEVKRRQDHINRIIAGAEELRPLIESCLHDDPNGRPTIAKVSKTLGIYRVRTEMSMGKPIEWWVSVSSSHQEQHQQNDSLKTQVEILKKENEHLKSEQKTVKQFMKEKKISKTYERYIRKHNPEQRSGSFVRRLSHRYRHKIPKNLPRSSSYPCIDKLV